MSKYSRDEVGQIIRNLGMSKKEAAAEMGVSYATIYAWERGLRTISDDLIDLLICKFMLRDAKVDGDVSNKLHRMVFDRH